MTILFKCDKVIRSMKNKIVKKGERKSMKKRKYLALLLAAGMIVQTALSTGGVVQVQAAEDTYVKTDELTDNDTAAPKKDSVIPSKNQYEYQKQELAAFCHFGPNTFNEIEWGEHYGDKTPNEIFKLTEDFDADTLVKTLKEAGFKKLIVTAKHHDGFCIFDSKYTDYKVKQRSTTFPARQIIRVEKVMSLPTFQKHVQNMIWTWAYICPRGISMMKAMGIKMHPVRH